MDELIEADRLEALYRRHGPEVLRFAYLLTGDKNLSEDLVQEAFVRVARRVAGLRSPDSFRWYLRRTVVNLQRDGPAPDGQTPAA